MFRLSSSVLSLTFKSRTQEPNKICHVRSEYKVQIKNYCSILNAILHTLVNASQASCFVLEWVGISKAA